jgi:hypothetical protein
MRIAHVRSCVVLFGLAAALTHTAAAQESPYAGMQDRRIKALSEDARNAYLSGTGMGLALAAELNGLPGPTHVLELADSLGLSDDQRARTEQLFATMQTEAIRLGEAIVGAEERLDRGFREGRLDNTGLAALTAEIGALQGTLRFTHLSAHLAMRVMLTDAQVLRYQELRGYGTDRSTHQHQHPQ